MHLASYEGILLVNQRKPLLHELLLAFVTPSAAAATSAATVAAAAAAAATADGTATSAVLHQLAQLALQDGRLLIDFHLLLLQRLQLVAYVIAAVPLPAVTSSSSAYSNSAYSFRTAPRWRFPVGRFP